MNILAIETSCDETAIAIAKFEIRNSKFEILSSIVSSQVKLHARYGGVYPSLAKREHQKNLPIVFRKALKEAKNPKIDLIAVTIGPGLEPCLWTGINFAKDLARKLKVPIVPINHVEAHILATLINRSPKSIKLPAVCLVVSGGHTQLILMKKIGEYKILGETRDDAAGECFDKMARILGLGYPGGSVIDKWAKEWRSKVKAIKLNINLPRPMIYQKNYDFSFSGLKTAVLYDFKSRSQKIRKAQSYIQEMAAKSQQAIIDVLIKKTIKAAKDFKVKSVILGGGVAASQELRRQFKKATKKEVPHSKFYIPDSKYCTDNAIMIAVTAYFRYLKGRFSKNKKIIANANLKV